MEKCKLCQKDFVPANRRVKYCSDECRDEARRQQQRRSTKAAPAELDTEARADRELERRLREQKIRAEATRRELADAKRELDLVKEENERLARSTEMLTAPIEATPDWMELTDYGPEGHRASLVAFLSDVHAGETVLAEEMNGYNAYNERITDLRLRRFFSRLVIVSRHYLAGVDFDGIVLALGGDMVSGDIHDELEQTNWCSTYDACRWLAPRLVSGIEMLAEEFGQVHVVSAPGNHGRDSKKPRSKKRSAHNADTHVAHLVADRLADEFGISFSIPETFDVDFTLYGSRFSMEHGDNMKSSGTSEIGAIGPAKRGTLRKSRQMQNEGRPFDYNLIGHFHQYVPAYTQGFIMNGSLKGYDEYARTWHLLPEPAQQALAVVTPEHGITINAPIIVTKRSDEGW